MTVRPPFSSLLSTAGHEHGMSCLHREGERKRALITGVAQTLNDAHSTIAELAGYRIKVKVNPAFSRPNKIERLVGSDAKLLDIIGNLPDFALTETLRWTLRSDA